MTPSLLPILLEAALRGLIAAAGVWSGLRVFRVKNVPAQKTAWGLTLLAALAMPLVMHSPWLPGWTTVKLPTSLLPARPVPAAEAAAPVSMALQPRSSEALGAEPEAKEPSFQLAQRDPIEEPDAAPDSKSGSSPVSVAPVLTQATSHPAITLARLLFSGWSLYLAVCAFLLLRLLSGLALSFWLWRGANRVDTSRFEEFPALTPVRWSSRISSPVNVGSGILLPADYAGWSEEKLRVVLAHEHSHILQRDFYLQFAAGLYAAFTWFSPLGWWLKQKLSDLGEAISDRAGLAAATSPSAYAGLLLEFAALPRPTLNGVAMASSRNLSHRIERLLNEASFQRAFEGGRRALLAVLITTVLIAAPAMVHVRTCSASQQVSAAEPAAAQNDTPAPAAVTGQSNPEPAQVTDAAAAQAPAAPANPETPPAAMPPAEPNPGPAPAPAPQAPEAGVQEPMPPMPAVPAIPPIHLDINVPPMPAIAGLYAYDGQRFCFAGGDSYAIAGELGTKTKFCGNWDDEGMADVDKARRVAHGPFLLFRHEGKLYVIDDAATVAQIEAMDQSREALSEQMRALGKQMRDASEQARDAARKARETAQNIPAPDLSKEIAALDASAASLKQQQGGTVSRQQLQELQRQISELQRQVMQAEIGGSMKEFNSDMALFGKQQGQYGAQMGKLGAQMGQMSRENNDKIRSIIDESLKNGKARPVN